MILCFFVNRQYDEYWKASGADKIKDKDLAYMHFDSAINHGVGGARELLKQSGGTFDGYYGARENKYRNIVKNEYKYNTYFFDM